MNPAGLTLSSEPRSRLSHPTGLILFGAATVVWMAFKLLYAHLRQLAPDEAYYWVWTRHSDWSYFDHPPMVAWMIKLGTTVFGSTELGVRCVGVISLGASILVLAVASRRIIRDASLWIAAAGILLLCPPIMVAGTIITPDTPAIVFQTLALAAAIRIFSATPDRSCAGLWLLMGLAFGFALLSKYTCVLAGAAVFAAMVSGPHGRRHVFRPWPWIGAMIALLLFLPVVYWNWQHDWASFRFQLGRDSGPATLGQRAIFIGEYIGGQIGAMGGVLVVIGIVCSIRVAMRWRLAEPIDRLLTLSCVVPLGFFLLMSFKGRVQLNWPAFAFVPMLLLIARAASSDLKIRGWMKVGGIIAAAMGVGLHVVPELLWKIKVKLPTDQVFGWREFANELHTRAKASDATIIADRYQYAALASFYLPGQPDIWSMNFGDARKNAYDYWEGKPDLNRLDRVLYTGKVDAELSTRFATVRTEEVSIVIGGRKLRTIYLVSAADPK